MNYRVLAPLKAAAAAPPVLTLVHWFDPTLLSAGAVSDMPNQIGGGPDAVQSNVTLQPIAVALVDTGDGTSALNGLTFDGVDDRIEVTLASSVSQFLMMAFIVPASVAANQALIGMTSGGTEAPLLQFGATSGKINVLLNGTTVVAQAAGTNMTVGNPFAVGAAYDGTTLRILHYNGSGAGTSATAGVALTSGNIFYIGGAPSRTSFNGQMGDVQIYTNWSGSATDLSTNLQSFFNTTFSKYFP